MNTERLREPVCKWRSEAARFRELGLESQARQAECYADEMEQAITEWELEPLTLEQAVRESGYSYSKLEKDVRAGKLPNAGDTGSPRIRRRDLPAKGTPARGIASLVQGAST